MHNFNAREHPSKVTCSRLRAGEARQRLSDLNWVKETPGVIKQSYTRLEATGQLARTFDEIGLVWFPQRPLPPHKTVLLRDVRRGSSGEPLRKSGVTTKIDLPLTVTPEVIQMRSRLYEINSFLAKQCITLDLDDLQLEMILQEVKRRDNAEQLVDLRRIQLVRIFSRGSLNKGGRFYRGWWQGIPSKYRPHIRINGKKTVEVDYSAMHLRMLYARAGIDYPADKDPYDLGLDDWKGKQDPRRKIIKVIINAMLNDEDGIFKLNKSQQNTLGLDNKGFSDVLRKAHPKLAEHIAAGIGLELQKLDSDIAEEVMLRLTREGIPCLPVHDSFIVSAGFELALREMLQVVFIHFVGVTTSVETDVVKDREHFGMSKEELDTIFTEGHVVAGSSLYEEIRGLIDDQSLMQRYLRSYEAQQ